MWDTPDLSRSDGIPTAADWHQSGEVMGGLCIASARLYHFIEHCGKDGGMEVFQPYPKSKVSSQL